MRCLNLMATGAILLGACCLPSLSAESPASAQVTVGSTITNLFNDKVLARGKGFQITRNQLDEAYIGYKASAAAQRQFIPESRRPEIETQVLERLINVQVLLTRATEADRAEAKITAAKNFDEYVKRMPSEDDFRRRVLSFGMTVDQFRARLLEDAMFRQVIDRELRSKIVISEEQVKQFYQTNAAQYDQPEKIRASHIVFLIEDPVTHVALTEPQQKEKKALAEKMLARLKAGEDFALLAKEYSEDPNTRNRGGELPIPFARGALMVKEFDAAAFALNTNQISGIVATPAGYHIIKLLEKIPARKIPLAEAEKEILEYLSYQEAQRRLPDYLKRLREAAQVEIVDSAFKR